MQNRIRSLLLTTIIVFFLSACSPSESVIATAIAQTQTAQPVSLPSSTASHTPSPTNTTQPTDTPTLTFTPLPTLTFTATATLTPTPDLRVIDTDPKLLLMTVEDLPSEGKYFLPNSQWISPHRNSEVVSGWGIEEGRKYLEETGRVDGWWVYYKRGTKTVNLPDEVSDNVVLYKTAAGARLLIDKYSDCRDPKNIRDYGYVELQDAPQVGDASIWCQWKEMQPNGKYLVKIFLEFTYKNVFHGIDGFGWENEVLPETLEEIANNLLAKLEVAPLSDRVTFTP